ncbi:MAG: DUF349 domain-containing protein [Bacteroidales bacterium]|jgi:hypothetical protein|nr:DUF349 domain-containing protein [Bacteroidales bacterium]
MDNLTNTPQEEVKQSNVETNNIENEIKTTDNTSNILDVAVEEEVHEEENTDALIRKYSQMTAEDLLQELKMLYEASNFELLKAKAALIRNAFISAISQEKKQDVEASAAEGEENTDSNKKESSIEKEFHALYSAYKDKRQKYLDEQEKVKQDNLNKKQAILEDLRQLLDSNGALKEIYDEFNAIQEKWKAIGQVPRTDVNALWENYHFLIEKFYDKVKISKELRDLDMKKNLEIKIELCEKVEALMLETSINKSFSALQEYHQQWKETGPVPSDKHDEIWERFKTASEQINERRKEYYEQKLAAMELNAKAKEALCEKIEGEILTKENKLVKDWLDRTEEVNELLKVWRSIGAVAKKDYDALWERFNNSMKLFFARKKEFFAKQKEEEIKHYNEKLEICVKAEAIALRNDWKKATNELLELQKQWKEIGYIQKERAEKLWQRFRAACDRFFAKKQEYFAQYHISEEENIAKKKAIIEEVNNYVFTEDKTTNLNAIKEFQRRWSEVGFISTAIREDLWQEFKKAINSHFEKLKNAINEFELNSFKDRVDANEGSNFSKERSDLQRQIQKLQYDLKTSENNIGFLAKSKSADILRAEYEKKIDKIRQEITLLQAKLQVLDSKIPSGTDNKTKQNNK